ncbi:MAG: DUF4405 domain-containing protein [Desulfocapsa sp.]|nr:DUF4405 domain-containing protein [Desulfocapsa sp.]
MNIRKITSMTMFISFILMVVTSIILYIVPQGRVAYWADWRMLGLSKTEWSNLHINLGFLFLFAGLLHVFYNWPAIKAYMKNRARELTVFTPSFNVALLLSLLVGIGTYFEIPPMSTVINFSGSIKDSAADKYGVPPYGHAELSSIKHFAKRQGLDVDKAIELLREANIQINDSSVTLADIAGANELSPQEIFEIMKPASNSKKDEEKRSFPRSPMTGFGKMTLNAICAEYNLLYQAVRQNLAEKGVKVEAEMSIKEIAAANEKSPMEIFELLYGIVNEM